ncbi:terminase ATPase subunit family protein [Burkholderia multivorans]|uniref:terminase ATPase subunit family protein n=1 Tax=Burkholderia multivorans TaxID=87883 RepID=UPI000D0053DD|nr:terminase ATPase subunit family protein [Burkholderia multivorans]MBU9569694.1 terminase ATPase subunit family protein [Burkholderia multivorans]PRF86369.1 oxidoreductase [Burkholderia multivorans]
MTALPIDSSDVDPRRRARDLYWQGYRIARIAEMLGEKPATLYSWKRRDRWDETEPVDRVALSMEAQLIRLVVKEKKEGRDFKEIDLLTRQLDRLRARPANDAKLSDSGSAGGSRRSRRADERNAFSDEQIEKLNDAFLESIFDYQRTWYRAGFKERIRNILKSRQIGATWYFAREALLDALNTGRNQIFLSASKAQAHVFRQYIVQFAKDAVDVELKGDPIVLPNGATLYFLGTNARTAQSYHGNLYFDEYFWVPRFQELRKVASGMAIHDQWRQTYFSTPSSLAHDAYPFWSGKLFNRGRPKDQHVSIDISHAALAAGRSCQDGQWRQIVTVEDAVRGGCNSGARPLFNLDRLRLEYSPEEYANLLLCQFIDDSLSVFPLTVLQPCMVDTWEVWDDFKPLYLRPFGDEEVWIGYDPSHTGDSAGCVVIAPPKRPGGKFRVLERFQWHGLDFEAQAAQIEALTRRYRVTYIGIDTTGIGQGVYQLVTKFFPAATPFHYSVEIKTALVMKAQNVIRKGRLEFDAGWNDLAASFMAIKKTITPSGLQVTYKASRSEEASHGDLAWACMHALANEPLEGATATNTGFMEIF